MLGEGGFSVVFEAVHNVTGREIALKLLHPHLTTTEQITERFLMEARAMARIRHDGIVQVFDAGTDPDGTVYIALELLNGESLETTLTRVRKLTWGEAVAIGIDLLGALAEAHRNKIIHRDIKPGNIYIVRKQDGSSQAKLLDFGIAHVTQSGQKLTQQGMILGTPEYMSPEQSRGIHVGPESDLWSVGIVMFECLVGFTPFLSETTTDILVKIVTMSAPPVTSLEALVPKAISDVIERSLSREAEQRYRSADDMARALEKARDVVDAARVIQTATPVSKAATPLRPSPPEILSASNEARASEQGVAPRAESNPALGRSIGRTDRANPLAASLRRPTPAMGQAVGAPRSSVGAVRVVEVDATRARDEGGSRSSVAPRREAGSPNVRSIGTSPEAPRPSPRPPLPPPEPALPSLTPPATGFDLDLQLPAFPGAKINSGGISAQAASSADSATSKRGAVRSFQPPPTPGGSRSGSLAMGAVLGAIAIVGGVVFALRSGHDDASSPVVSPSRAAAGRPLIERPDASAPPIAPIVSNLQQLRAFSPGVGLAGTDALSDFARHAAASGPSSAQRIVVSCLSGTEGGPTVVIHPLNGGPTLGSFRGPVACDGFDLGVVPDVTDDGTDDVVATNANGTGIVVIDSRSLRVWRTIPVPGARGIALGGGYAVRGSESDVVAIVYTEPDGPGAPSQVRAVSLRRQRVLWSVSGSNPLGRVGQPVELGLAIGPDATQDGVPDVVMGIGPMGNSVGSADPRRCVQLYSGANGAQVWSEPSCRRVGRSAQSVALGVDINGDGRGDVAVGTDQHDVAASVVVLSGANGTPLLSVAAPVGERGTAFGWPVALAGDLDGDNIPDLAVGTVGRQTRVTLINARTGAFGGVLTLSGDGAGNLRMFPVEPTSASEPWSVLLADPGNGLRLMARRVENEPL